MSVKFGDIDLNSDLLPVEENRGLDEITTDRMVNDALINQSSNHIRVDEIRVLGVGKEVEGVLESGDTETSDGGKQSNGMVLKDFNGVEGKGGGTDVRADLGVKDNDVAVVDRKEDDFHREENNVITLVVDLNTDRVAHGERKFNGLEGFGVNEMKNLSGAGLDDLVNNASIGLNSIEIGNPSSAIMEKGRCIKEVSYDEKGCKNTDAFKEDSRIDKEGDFHVTDLVWGKVTSHPWWPGQIYDPSCASKKALKYKKKDSFLIAYYGDQSFAWNDASRIKPFRMYFSQMEKQSNMDSFTHAVNCALEEFSRRVEFGLACSCLPKEVFSKIESQVIVNAGIRKVQGVTVGGDSFSTAASFVPAKLVHCLKELGETPFDITDRLQFVTARAQLLAFNRWKGNAQLPSFALLGGLLESDDFPISEKERDLTGLTDYALVATKFDGKENSFMQDSSSRKHKNITGDDSRLRKKNKHMLELMPENYLDGEDKGEGKAVENNIYPSGKKITVVDSTPTPTISRGKSHVSPAEKLFEVGDRIRKVASQLSGSVSFLRSGESTSQNGVNKKEVNHLRPLGASYSGFEKVSKVNTGNECTVAEMLFHLSLVAGNPMKAGGNKLISMIRFFTDFRNSVCLENSNPENIQLLTSEMSITPLQKSSDGFKGLEEYYRTNMISQGTFGEQTLNKTEGEKEMPNVEEAAEQSNVQSNENLGHANEELEKYSPTTFILNFTDLESIPSEENLNKIFSKHGPLIESDTEVLKKSNRAKVVFKRCDDAESAFSSPGKFKTFGPSLVSYRLHYSPSPRKPSNPGRKRKRKDVTSVKGKEHQIMI